MTVNFDDSTIGKDVEALCSKCGQSWHVISAVLNGKIERVECKSCQNQHKYRPVPVANRTLQADTRTSLVDNSVSAKAAPKAKKSVTATTRSAFNAATAEAKENAEKPKTRKSVAAKPQVFEPKVPANENEIQNYSLKIASYSIGDRILHPKFGLGIVEEFPEPQKMRVCFPSQRVLLVYGK